MKPKARILNKAFADHGYTDVILWDVVRVPASKTFRLVFESVNADRPQGVWMRSDLGIEVEGKIYPSIYLWHTTAPPQVIFKCHTENGLLDIYNVWKKDGQPRSLAHTSGMKIESLENGWRYRCNDIGFDGKFDRLVFRLEPL